jgi:hypothetical protein
MVLIVGCSAPGGTPQPLVVQGLTNEDLLFTATITDQTGSLEGAVVIPANSTGIGLTNPEMEGIASDGADGAALFVAWVGLPCEDRPSLQIAAAASGLVVQLDKGPQREGAACPFYPHYFALRLQFDGPIDVEGVQLQVAD